jgi:hypothetical protein
MPSPAPVSARRVPPRSDAVTRVDDTLIARPGVAVRADHGLLPRSGAVTRVDRSSQGPGAACCRPSPRSFHSHRLPIETAVIAGNSARPSARPRLRLSRLWRVAEGGDDRWRVSRERIRRAASAHQGAGRCSCANARTMQWRARRRMQRRCGGRPYKLISEAGPHGRFPRGAEGRPAPAQNRGPARTQVRQAWPLAIDARTSGELFRYLVDRPSFADGRFDGDASQEWRHPPRRFRSVCPGVTARSFSGCRAR